MLEKKTGSKIEVDIHGMRADEARRQLELLLTRAGKDVEEITVIHGYHNGQVLLDMVRRQLKHPRIEAKMLSLNSGQTRIILKRNK